MARLNFLTVTDTSNWFPVLGIDGALLAQHAFVRSVLLDIAPELADLFAEPVYRRQPSGKIDSVTWYTQAQGAIKKLNHLEPDFRENIIADLTVQIGKCAELCRHAEIGNILAGMLQLGAHDSIMVVGRKPVLINWALNNPEIIDADHPFQSINEFWRDLLSQPDLALLTETIQIDAPSETAEQVLDSQGTELIPAVADNSTQDDAPEDLSEEDRLEFREGDGRNTVQSRENVTAEPYSPPEGEAIQRKPQVTVEPQQFWRDRLWFWGGWIVAALLLFFLFFVLWWHFWGHSWWAQGRNSSMLDALKAERDRLLEMVQDPCAPEAQGYLEQNALSNPEIITPSLDGAGGPTLADAATGLQSEAVDEAHAEEPAEAPQKIQSGDDNHDISSAQPKSMTELAKAAEKSIVLILSASRDGSASMGTGFFISPELIVTNRHVVERSRDSFAFVTSEWLGNVQKAKIVAMSPDAEIGNSDFALLKLSSQSTGVPLPVSNKVDKLMRVVAAGYPAFLTQGDPALKRLIGGDRNSAPEMVFTTGEVSVVQKHVNKPDIVIHSADISQGNSGGPLMNACGEVVGVNTFVGQDAQSGRRGLFSISGADLQDFLRQHGASFEAVDGPCRLVAGE